MIVADSHPNPGLDTSHLFPVLPFSPFKSIGPGADNCDISNFRKFYEISRCDETIYSYRTSNL